MQNRVYENAADFLKHTESCLVKDEARYGRILGMAQAAMRLPHLFKLQELWYCSLNTGAILNAVAISGRNRGEVLLEPISGDKSRLAKELVKAVSRILPYVTVTMGEKELTDIFAGLWCQEKHVKIQSTMQSRLFRLDKVNDVPIVPGKMRAATMQDLDLVKKWAHAFSVEIEGGRKFNMPEPDITPVVELGFAFFWEVESKPVSMAFKSSPTDKGMTINHVYTPPESRKRGYATSCVAELSKDILKSGKEFCILTTDLSNPISNAIYMKIGYKPVCDTVWHGLGK